jgi:hypothetical protein
VLYSLINWYQTFALKIWGAEKDGKIARQWKAVSEWNNSRLATYRHPHRAIVFFRSEESHFTLFLSSQLISKVPKIETETFFATFSVE